jgi:PAS domain S-box-containing protein
MSAVVGFIADQDLFTADGEIGTLLRNKNWTTSPLGAPQDWPRSLRSTVRLVLNSRFPMFLAWGKELGFLYNDAYAEILGTKHPDALGGRFQDVWQEIWPDILPLVDAAMSGEATYRENLPLSVLRKGFIEQTWFTFSYSPLHDDDGRVAGMFCACTDTTQQVWSARRREALLALDERLREISNPTFLAYTASELLGQVLGASRVGYGVFDAAAGTVTVDRDWCAQGLASVAGLHRFEDYGAYVGHLRRGEPVINHDVAVDPLTANNVEAMRAISVAAFLDMPIVEDGRTVAQIFVHSVTPRTWLPDEVAFVRDFAQRTRVVIARRLAERDLRESRTRLAAIFNEAPVGLSEIGLDGTFLSVNSGLCAILQRSREDVLAGSISNITHPDDVQQSLEQFRKTVETGEALSFDKRYVRPDGTLVWANSNLTRLDDGSGQPRAVLAVTIDLTERLLQEAALRDETRALETLNGTGAALAAELDLSRLLQTLCDAAVEITGAKFGAYFHNMMDETGERLHLYTLSGAERAAFDRMGRPRATAIFGPTFRNETIIRSGDITLDPRYGQSMPHRGMPEGHLPVRSYLAIPVVSRSEEVLGGLIFGHPEPDKFTERHERLITGIAAQAAVAIDNAHLFQAVQVAKESLERRVEERTAERNRVWAMSRDLFAVMGFDGYLKEINPAWETTLGYNSDTILSKPFPEQVHPDDHSAVELVIARLRQGEVVTRFEDRIRHADGSWRWIAWALVPDGEVFYAVGRDITGEKEAATELEQVQEALRQSQKMEAVGQLTGGLAHDFNNILAGISGSLEMMSTRMAQGRIGDLDRYINGASSAAKRAAGLTQRLLAFSRRQTLDPKPANLTPLVTGMLELINRSMGPGIEVETAGATGLWTTFVDAGQLENALLNLCINARDAMPDGGKLTIETANRWMDERGAHQHGLTPGQYVSLCVSDTGTGMSREVMDRAFDPFFTTKPIGQGTGLGLSMVYGFAGQSGGAVRIYSELGKGTMICIYLPRHRGEAQAVEELQLPGDAPRASSAETVLVVDDEPLIRMLAVEALEELGYTIIEADDGTSALKVLNSERIIDLLITDVGLPGGLNGRQVADAARISRPDLKVLFITGYAENAVLNHGHLDQSMHVLTKPFEMDAFARKVKALITDRQG